MMRQAGVIRVETIEQLMDVAQIVSSQPLPKGPGVAVFSNSRALGKVVADSAAAQGLGVERIVTDVDLDAGMSVALPALRHSLQEVLTADTVHAAVVALLPARGLTVEKIAGVLAECSVAAGKPVVAAFSGLLDPSIYVEGMVGDEAGSTVGSLLLQPRRGGGRAGIRGPLRPVAGPGPGPVCGTRGLRPGRHPRRAGTAAGTASAASSCVRLDAGDGRAACWPATASGWSRPSASTPPTRPSPPRTGSAGRWR